MSSESLAEHIHSASQAQRWRMPPINIFYNIPHLPKYYPGTNNTIGTCATRSECAEDPGMPSLFRREHRPCAIHKVSARRLMLYTPTIEDFDNYRRSLRAENFDFYTTTPPQRKHRILVLHGLPAATTATQVQAALLSHPLLTAANTQIHLHSVVEYHPQRANNQRRQLRRPLFLIVLAAHSGFFTLMVNIDEWPGGHKCRWSVFQRSLLGWPLTPTVQCHRCQRLGHVSKNCNMTFRCVKCAEPHSFGACQVPLSTARSQLYCVLCRSKGHPASYAGCPRRVALRQKRKQRADRLWSKRRAKRDEQVDGEVEKALRIAGMEDGDGEVIGDAGSVKDTADTSGPSIDIEQVVETLHKVKLRMSNP